MKDKICCVTGHRPEGFPWDYYDETLSSQIAYYTILKDTIEHYIKEGYNIFICGGARGVDMDFAELVLKFREYYPWIQLEIAVPYTKQAVSFNDTEKSRYNNILSQANKVTLICKHYTGWCMHKRNRYMVDKSDIVIGIWNVYRKGGTHYTIRYAEKRNKPLNLICLQEFIPEEKELEDLLFKLAQNTKLHL